MIRQNRIRQREERISKYGNYKSIKYKELTDAGYYLPPFSSPAITSDYLRGVSSGDYLSIQTTPIPYLLIDVTKESAYCILIQCTDRDLGFDIKNMPCKQWMLNLAYHVHPNHMFFISPERIAAANIHETYLERTTDATRLVRAIPSRKDIQEHFKPVLIQELRYAILSRLKLLRLKYPICTINLNKANTM